LVREKLPTNWEERTDDNTADDSSCGIRRGTARSQILVQSVPQDALGFNALWWARDIVERAGAERRHVGVPVSQV